MPDPVVKGKPFQLRAEQKPIDPVIFRPVAGLHRIHPGEQIANMLGARRNFLRCKISQAIIPRMQAGIAAPHRILLVAPIIKIFRQLLQRGGVRRLVWTDFRFG